MLSSVEQDSCIKIHATEAHIALKNTLVSWTWVSKQRYSKCQTVVFTNKVDKTDGQDDRTSYSRVTTSAEDAGSV